MESKEAFSRIRASEDSQTKNEILTSELSKAMQRAESLSSAYFEKLELSARTEEEKAALMSLKEVQNAEKRRWRLAAETPCMFVFSCVLECL